MSLPVVCMPHISNLGRISENNTELPSVSKTFLISTCSLQRCHVIACTLSDKKPTVLEFHPFSVPVWDIDLSFSSQHVIMSLESWTVLNSVVLVLSGTILKAGRVLTPLLFSEHSQFFRRKHTQRSLLLNCWQRTDKQGNTGHEILLVESSVAAFPISVCQYSYEMRRLKSHLLL